MTNHTTTAPASTLRRFGLPTLLLLGPVLSVLAIAVSAGRAYFPGDLQIYALLAGLLLWSPLPVSVSAVLLGDARDNFRTGQYGLRRSAALYPYLLSRTSGVRGATVAHLVGFMTAIGIATLALR